MTTLPRDWRRLPLANLHVLLDTLDDSTQEWDNVMDEVRAREDARADG